MADADADNDGWYADPWQRWPERYFERGQPTDRVRYGAALGRDPIPLAPVTPPYPGQRQSWYGQGYGTPVTYGSQSPSPASGYGFQHGWGQYQQPRPTAGSGRTGPLPLHPMTVSDILDGAFRLYRANFKAILLITMAVAGPLDLVSALVRRGDYGGTSIFNSLSTASVGQTSSGSTSTVVALGITGLISFIVLPCAGGAISRLVSSSYIQGVELPGQALKSALRRAWPLLAASFLVHLMEIVGFIALIVPGLVFMALYVCVAPAIVIEGLGPIQGMKRSWALNKPRLWRVMGIALLSGLVVSLVGSVFSTPLQVAAVAIGLRWGWILLFLGELLASVVTLSLNAIIATLLYFDGRIRQEGFDLQVLARGIGS